jgi:DNA-binding IclR family transcriptional regulator
MRPICSGTAEVDKPGSVGKALALLRMLQDHKTLRVMDVSRGLGIAPSTAHRLLTMFAESGFLRQETRNSAYSIGPALVEFATVIAGQVDIEMLVRPYVSELARELNETALLCVLRGDRVVYLDAVESTHALRAVSQTGRSIPAHATAGGKALLAQVAVPDLCRIYPNESLGRLTPKTVDSRTALLAQLARIRERGYALNAEESELHFAACGAVVRDRTGMPKAAIVVAGPAARLRRYEPGRVAAAVRSACANASAVLAT